MLYFSIENARGEREVTSVARRVAADGFLLGCCSDPAQLFSRNFFEMLESHFAWQAQYLVSLDNDTCCSAHCK